MQPDEKIIVETATVACHGGTELGHPVVYLNVGAKGAADCPYCGRHFVLAAGARTGSGH
jgi:uncharacterized Zn-finger protein